MTSAAPHHLAEAIVGLTGRSIALTRGGSGTTGHMSNAPPKLNCWEFMRCGRQPGGERVGELGICPAVTESRLNGVFHGTNAGRCCWAVAGTFCKGGPEGTFAKRYASCTQCEFFKHVEAEEVPVFSHTASLLLYVTSIEGEEGERYRRLMDIVLDPAVTRSWALNATEETHITALFADLGGFPTVTNRLNTSELSEFLTDYLSAMTDVIRSEGGTLDKYTGDGIVAIFGAPEPIENNALSAARAAVEMQGKLATLRARWRSCDWWGPDIWSLRMRIGISTGLAKVGFLGTAHFAAYTMVGSTVSLASWLEKACETYGAATLVSEATQELIASEMIVRRIDSIHHKSIPSNTIYELLGPRDSTPS